MIENPFVIVAGCTLFLAACVGLAYAARRYDTHQQQPGVLSQSQFKNAQRLTLEHKHQAEVHEALAAAYTAQAARLERDYGHLWPQKETP